MKISTFKLPEKLAPYSGIIGFIVVLLLSNWFWKYNVFGDEEGSYVSFWGMDVSAPFVFMARHAADVAISILHFWGWDISLDGSNVFHYNSGFKVQIVWACTGLKQAYICLCILIFSRGPWRKKLWYIPVALFVVYLFNLFRITFILAVVDEHPDWFHFLHIKLFKYLFYAVIFGMWVIWEEKIAIKKKKIVEHIN